MKDKIIMAVILVIAFGSIVALMVCRDKIQFTEADRKPIVLQDIPAEYHGVDYRQAPMIKHSSEPRSMTGAVDNGD